MFGGRSGGMLGPSVGVYAELPMGIAAQLKGEYDFALGAGDIVSARASSVSALLVAEVGRARALEIGTGPFIGNLAADAPGPYQPSTVSQGFWGVAASARYALRKDGWRLAMGADARFYAFRPEIAVDGNVVWGLPVIGMGLAVEFSREVYRSP